MARFVASVMAGTGHPELTQAIKEQVDKLSCELVSNLRQEGHLCYLGYNLMHMV
jgi:hypothetical protein